MAYALGTLQERGSLFVEPGTECYEGMLVGERNQPGDMVVNIARTKNLGNQRSSTSDISIQLVPPRTFSLEEALEYIVDDELVEITPKNIRMRKRLRRRSSTSWTTSSWRSRPRTSACASACSTRPTARRPRTAPSRTWRRAVSW